MRAISRSGRLAALSICLGVLLAGCNPATVTPSQAGSAALSASASSVASAAASGIADPGDEPIGSETPAIGYTPGPTGGPVPTSSAAAMTRLPGEPDPALTTGSTNPAVTQADIGSTICTSGWTATIRPPVSYTNGLKVTQIVQYGYADKSMASYEEDHLISLELGGSPTDPKNLWPEPYTISLADGRATGAHIKDAFETKLKNEVCAGTMTLAEAQAEIGIHWVHFRYGLP